MLFAEEISLNKGSRVLLKNISLSFERGNIYGILGPNGAGKSSFLKAISGIWPLTTGRVIWQGESLLEKRRSEVSQVISLVPQNPQSAFSYTVQEIVTMSRYTQKGNLRKNDSIIHQALVETNSLQFRHLPITELSQGERQRVYIARALAAETPVLLLDEPMTGLDIAHQQMIWQLLLRIRSQNKVIILSIHDLEAAKKYCDQVSVIRKGECTRTGLSKEILQKEMVEEYFS